MSSGHSWSDIKKYTLSEIGVFLRSVKVKRSNEKIENISFGWMSSNLDHEGIEKVIKDIQKESLPLEEKTKEEVGNEWRRLASLKMG